MNILEEIRNCPVEWKELGEVAFIKRGKTITSFTLCGKSRWIFEFLKTDEINLDYILALIVEKSKNSESKEVMKEEVSRVIRSSIDICVKEELVIGFINDTDLQKLKDYDGIINAFYEYGKERKKIAIHDLAESEKLVDDYQLFIDKSIQRGYAENSGTDLDSIIPPTSRRQGVRERKKQEVLRKIQLLVETYSGI